MAKYRSGSSGGNLHIPNPIGFRADSASDINTLLQTHSNTSLDFTPSHILKPIGTTFKDILGDWDMTSTGGDATIRSRAIRTVNQSKNGWVASSNSKFQFGTSNFAFLMITKFSGVAGGGYYFSNLKGPAADDPYAPGGGSHFGTDRGYGISSNGDGGIGFGIYGVGGYTNADTPDGSIDLNDNVWRAISFGYSQTSSTAFLTGPDFGIAFAGAIGNTSNTDAICGFRTTYYNITQSNANQETALLCVFEGDAAQSVYLQRTNYSLNLQRVLLQ